MTRAQNPNLIRPLEGLRALAIIVVLLFHLDVPYFTGGYIGVDLFFVISGYIITKNIAEKSYANKFSIAEFYVKRIRRLFPALFLTILATLIAGYFFLTPYDYEELTKSGLFSTFSLANIHFWQSAGYFDTASHMKPLLHMWSLSVEEQFYIIWPTLLLGLIALAKKWNNAITIGIATIFLISALGAVIVSMSSPPTAFFWFVFRIYQFMAGAFLVFIPNSKDQSTSSSHSTIPLMPLLSILGLISLIGASIYFDKNSNTALVGISSIWYIGQSLFTINMPMGALSHLMKCCYWGEHQLSVR